MMHTKYVPGLSATEVTHVENAVFSKSYLGVCNVLNVDGIRVANGYSVES
jgi:hypothetical protein